MGVRYGTLAALPPHVVTLVSQVGALRYLARLPHDEALPPTAPPPCPLTPTHHNRHDAVEITQNSARGLGRDNGGRSAGFPRVLGGSSGTGSEGFVECEQFPACQRVIRGR